MDTPFTEVHSADDVASSIHAFGDCLHNAFQEVTKSRHKVVGDFRLPKHIKDLKRERNRFRRVWQMSSDRFTLNHDVVNPRIVDIVISDVEQNRFSTQIPITPLTMPTL